MINILYLIICLGDVTSHANTKISIATIIRVSRQVQVLIMMAKSIHRLMEKTKVKKPITLIKRIIAPLKNPMKITVKSKVKAELGYH